MARFQTPVDQFFDDAGDPLIDGKLIFKSSGTNTDLDTYADVNLSIPNTNPVILTAAGRAPNIFLKSATYKVILTDMDDVQIWSRDPVGGETAEGNFSPWNSLTVYNKPDIVQVDDKFYISITNDNQGNEVTDPTNWTEIKFNYVWNANQTYVLHDIVQGSNGSLYVSQVASNTGNDPVTDSVNWTSAVNTDVELPLIQATTLSF